MAYGSQLFMLFSILKNKASLRLSLRKHHKTNPRKTLGTRESGFVKKLGGIITYLVTCPKCFEFFSLRHINKIVGKYIFSVAKIMGHFKAGGRNSEN